MSGKTLNEEREKLELQIYLIQTHLGFVTQILQRPLPKYGYSKRTNGKKKKQMVNSKYRSKTSKFLQLQMKLTFQYNQLVMQYQEAMKNYTVKGSQSIKELVDASSDRPQPSQG